MTREITNWSKYVNQNTLIILALIALIIWLIFKQIRENYLMDDPMLKKLKQLLEPLDPEIRNVKLYKGNKSYTINKERIYLCLFDEKGDYYPENLLVYVCLHELAHYLNKEDVGHTPIFQAKFDDLLEKAEEMGIYDSSIPIDPDYCMHT